MINMQSQWPPIYKGRSLVPITVILTKYDLFQKLEPKQKKVFAMAMRNLCFTFGCDLVGVGGNELKHFRGMLTLRLIVERRLEQQSAQSPERDGEDGGGNVLEEEAEEASKFKFPPPRVDPEKVLHILAGTDKSQNLQEPAVQMRGTMDELWMKDLQAVFTTIGSMKQQAREAAANSGYRQQEPVNTGGYQQQQ